MSSKPSPAGAAKVLELIDQASALDSEIAQLRPMKARLEVAEAERARVGRDLAGHLRSMDCDSPGNYGWEGRFGWLLAEVARQARAGRLRVVAEVPPVSADAIIAEQARRNGRLRAALSEAVSEVTEHNASASHRTAVDRIEAWRALADEKEPR